jgi:hypothetical protein
MIAGRLAAFGIVVAAACGAAWGQARPPLDYVPKPGPEEALSAVLEAGCERSETASYVRFHCKEGEALWYFTPAGHAAHPSYLVFADHQLTYDNAIIPDRKPRSGRLGFGRGGSGIDHDAFSAWNREVFKSWMASAPRVSPRFGEREPRGKLYPLEP